MLSMFAELQGLELCSAFGFALALYAVLSCVFKILGALYRAYIRPSKNFQQYGEWAVVTGATDGIGLEYAKQLAAKGLNVVIISRTQSKLDAVKAEIEKASSGVEVRTIAADMTEEPSTLYPRIAAQIKDLDIGVLINNVGMGYDHPEFFTDISQERVDQLVRINIASVNQMTRIVLPGMQERKRGAIVNVSSGSGTLPTALLTVYSATKGYVDLFSRGLATEVANKGIFVQSLVPLLVVSKLSKVRKPSLFTPTPKTFVKSALRTIGYDRYTAGYLFHNLQLWVMHALPESVVEKQLLGMHLSLRKRALRKAQKSQ